MEISFLSFFLGRVHLLVKDMVGPLGESSCHFPVSAWVVFSETVEK